MSPRDSLHSLYQLLVHPSAFFEEHPPAQSLGMAAGVVIGLAIVSALSLLAIGWLLSSQIDATMTVTTLEPWPESTCESFREMNVSSTPEPCTIDEPRTKQVDIGSKAYSIFAGRTPVVFFGVLFGWPIVAIGLHVLSALSNGEGSFAETLAVAGLGMLPSIFQTVATTGTMAVAVLSMEFGSNPEVVTDRLRDVAAAIHHPLVVLVVLLVAAWQTWIWAAGLERARCLDRGSALFAAGVVAAIGALSALI